MKKIRILSSSLLLILLLQASLVSAAEFGQNYLRIERNKESETDLRFTTIGGFGLSGNKAGHVDLSFIESPRDGDALALDMGAAFAYRAGVTFYVGAGLLLGYAWDVEKFVGSFYPEVGVVGMINPAMGISLSTKRYYNLHDRDEDVFMIGIILSE